MLYSLKIYVPYTVYSVIRSFLGGGVGGRLLEGGAYLIILALGGALIRRGGAYLKLGANSSIYGKCMSNHSCPTMMTSLSLSLSLSFSFSFSLLFFFLSFFLSFFLLFHCCHGTTQETGNESENEASLLRWQTFGLWFRKPRYFFPSFLGRSFSLVHWKAFEERH